MDIFVEKFHNHVYKYSSYIQHFVDYLNDRISANNFNCCLARIYFTDRYVDIILNPKNNRLISLIEQKVHYTSPLAQSRNAFWDDLHYPTYDALFMLHNLRASFGSGKFSNEHIKKACDEYIELSKLPANDESYLPRFKTLYGTGLGKYVRE